MEPGAVSYGYSLTTSIAPDTRNTEKYPSLVTQTLEGYDRHKMRHIITRMSTKEENTTGRHKEVL